MAKANVNVQKVCLIGVTRQVHDKGMYAILIHGAVRCKTQTTLAGRGKGAVHEEA